MEVKTQTVEQFLFEQLEKVAPEKYTLVNVLQLFESRLRFPCSHLKGGKRSGLSKDYNLSIFTFPDGITEIKCLYNCGLKIRSDEKELTSAFKELLDLPTSNTKAAAEWLLKRNDSGPAPTYSDEYRQRIKDSTDMFWKAIEQGLQNGRIKPDDPILGGVLPHPDPKEAPEFAVERGIKQGFAKMTSKPSVLIAQAIFQDSILALKPKKIRKTQSRKRGKQKN